MPKQELPVVKASLRDLAHLRRLERQCFSREDIWPLIELLGVLVSPGTVRLKVDDGEEMVAFLSGEVQRAKQVGWIGTIGVAPRWRHKGLGRRLLAAGEQAMGMPTIRLSVRKSNQDAIRLYEKAGYNPIGEIKRYYNGGEDALVYEKKLPNLRENPTTPIG